MVGNWLRDFEAARKVMDDLSGRNDIEFHVISMEANRHHFAGCKNVIFRSRVPIADYMDELHGADLMMLPLKSGTSNLAVLEAMAVGLPVGGDVTVTIYDARGARVRELHHGYLDGGTRTLVWNGRDQHGRAAASGVYFVRATVAGQHLTGRMVLVK